MGMGVAHEATNVGPESLAQEQVAPADGVDVVPVAPDLVGRARETVAAARGAVARLLRLAVAVEPEHGAEGAPLEPADEQFSEFGRARVAAVEPAYVRRPPGDPGQSSV